ncbi:MAG: hypothetical protein KAW51_10060 [Candidatus Lokiarchaeota archaeon]|nr:hypothetical protein [Candidatus Lokiarchaeota archaeon]
MDLKSLKKAFPYKCNSCGEFLYTLAEYCEICGTKGSLRETNNVDFEERGIDLKMSSISEKEAEKCLIYSIVMIVATFFLALLGLSYPLPGTTGIYIFLLSLMWMLVGIVSLIFYFINPEISYGMLMSRKKTKNINTRNVKIGRRILMVIMMTGLCFMIYVFIRSRPS